MDHAAPPHAPTRTLATLQGLLYLASGLWPLVSMRTFEAVTGPKRERWLVRTVGLLAVVIGAVLLRRSTDVRTQPDPILAIGSAASFAGVDVWYAGRGRISKVYLLDALAEIALIGAWLGALRGGRDATGGDSSRP